MQYTLVSVDDHLDLNYTPADLWQQRLPARYRDIGPKVVERPEGHMWMWEGEPRGLSGRRGTWISRAAQRFGGSRLNTLSGRTSSRPSTRIVSSPAWKVKKRPSVCCCGSCRTTFSPTSTMVSLRGV